MGRKMKRKSQKHLLRRDAFHPSQAARRKEHRHSNFFLFPSLSLILLSSRKTPWYLRTTPMHHRLNSLPRTTFQSHFFQSIDIIPSAPFSPITLCHVVIWAISAVPWLGQRGVPGLGKVLQSHVLSGDKTYAIFNHIHTKTKCVSYLTLKGGGDLGTCLMTQRE